jgi:hypothetical protein
MIFRDSGLRRANGGSVPAPEHDDWDWCVTCQSVDEVDWFI